VKQTGEAEDVKPATTSLIELVRGTGLQEAGGAANARSAR